MTVEHITDHNYRTEHIGIEQVHKISYETSTSVCTAFLLFLTNSCDCRAVNLSSELLKNYVWSTAGIETVD